MARSVKPVGLPSPPQRPSELRPVDLPELLSEHSWEAISAGPADLSGGEFDEPRFEGVELSGLLLAQAKVRHLVLEDGVLRDLDGAGLRAAQAQLRRVTLRGCRLTGAQLGASELSDLTAEDCRFDYADLGGAQLRDSVLLGCDLREADLSHANFVRVRLERCDLRGADLRGASLSGCQLDGCRLDGAQGLEALRGAQLPAADIVAGAAIFAAALGITPLDE